MQIVAAVLRDAAGAYQLEPLELGPLGPTDVLVRIVGAGMCHTDVLPRAPESLSPPPIVTGHEGAGVVEAVGAEVVGVRVGDHVVLSYSSCGACRSCQLGQPSYCAEFLFRNLLGRNLDGTGGATDADGNQVGTRWFGQSSFASHSVVPERNVVVVDPALPLEQLGPLGCGLLTGAGSVLTALDAQPGSSIVVYGVGAVGMAAVMAARVAEASTVIAVDLHAHRLELAAELGATATLVGSDPDLAARILELTGGGADHVVDTTGNPDVMLGALGALRLGGSAAFVGVQTGPLTLDPLALVGKTVIGVLEGSAAPQDLVPRLIELWQAGRFPFDRLIETFPLDQIDAAEAASLSGQVIKPVLLPPTAPSGEELQ